MSSILEQLESLIATGTETEVRAFVVKHFKELPEAMQKDLAVELFKEAMEKDFSDKQAIAEMKKEVVEAIDIIEEMEKQETKES